MKKILVVVDMQNDFTTGPLGNKECAAVIPEVISVMQNTEYDRIIFTKDTHQDNYLQTQEGKRLPVPHCMEGTKGWEIVPSVAAAAEGTITEVIHKPTFGSVALGETLKKYSESMIKTQRNADHKTEDAEVEIDFCGVCTGICVISNVMIAKAFVPEARICVIEKACACVTPQSHQTAIEAMKTCQVDMI